MFNAPRPAQGRSNGTFANTFGGSFVDENPLASSTYDGLDPWSSASIVSVAPTPQIPGAFSNIIADATVPAIYHKAFAAVDSGAGDTSVNSLIRVLSSSGLPATTVDRIVNLVSSRTRVSKLEFFVALALVALAQSGKDVSIEHIAAHAQENTLPEPSLDLSSILSTSSDIRPSTSRPIPSYSDTHDPWSPRSPLPSDPSGPQAADFGSSPFGAGAPSSLTGALGRNWWKTQAKVDISILPEKQGFILNRYTVYQVQSNRGAPVPRRYSEFTYLWDCLVRRYPFRILPSLPPKRIGADGGFLEQRRKGLVRFLQFVVNHPVLREDGLLAIFLTEPSLEAWRKHSSISLEEESVSKRIDRMEEMSIPSDLEDKMIVVRGRVNLLIEQWSRLCVIAERVLKRREAGASDLSRFTMTLNALVEENPESWRSEGDDFYLAVRQGLSVTSRRLSVYSDALEQRTRVSQATTLEALKSQRDLYIATRDLFTRHDKLSGDQVDKLKKRVDTNSQKLENIKAARKEGWAAEADKVLGSIELDQSAIATCMARRVFIRHSVWHELRAVLYNRENTLLSLAVQSFARGERDFAEAVHSNWTALAEEAENMPFE